MIIRRKSALDASIPRIKSEDAHDEAESAALVFGRRLSREDRGALVGAAGGGAEGTEQFAADPDMRGSEIAARARSRRPFHVIDQHFESPVRRIDANAVAVADFSDIAAGGRFGRDVEGGGNLAGGAREPP